MDPDADDVRFLREELGFHPADVREVHRLTRQPEVEAHPSYLFLVVHVPHHEPAERATVPREVDIFVRSDVVVTAHAERVHLLDGLFRDASAGSNLSERLVGRGPAYLLYSIMDHLFDSAWPMLEHVIESIDAAERRMFRGQERQLVGELSVLQRDLIGFRSIIRPQTHLYEAGALHGEWDSPAFRVVFRSLHAKLARLWGQLEVLWERIDALARTNDTLVNHQLNEFVKLLTVLGALFIPFGLVAQTAVFINDEIPLPNRLLFWGIIGLMLIVDFVVVWKARSRKIL